MYRVADDIINSKRTHVIVTMPPGYRKTNTFVVNLIARGMAINPSSRFLYSSYSDTLVQEHSDKVRSLIKSEAYQARWPNTKIQPTVDAKGLWRTYAGGGLLAAPAGGTITGFRAGYLDRIEKFTGALIIDDPVKPDDALTVEREKINKRWHTTFKSRLAHNLVPVVIIGQRIHDDDFIGYLLKGGAGVVWDHLHLPILIDNAKPYPKKWTHGRPIKHGLPDGPLWAGKDDRAAIAAMEVDDYTFQAQYLGEPTPLGGAVFKEEHLLEYRSVPQLKYRVIYGDTAQKLKEKSDYSVFQLWGKGADGKAYLLDQIRDKWDADALLTMAKTFFDKARAETHPSKGPLREIVIEDKSSGTGLIQQLKNRGVPVRGMPRDKDKYTRALNVIPQFTCGFVMLPPGDGTSWLPAYKRELLSFTGDNRTKDDQVDATLDAVYEMCVSGRQLGMDDVL